MWRLLSLNHNIELGWSLGKTICMSYWTSNQFWFSCLFNGYKGWKNLFHKCIGSKKGKASLIHIVRQKHLTSPRFFELNSSCIKSFALRSISYFATQQYRNNPSKNRQRIWIDTPLKKKYKWLISILVIREIHIRTTVKYHFTPTRMAKTKKTDSSKC